jgi:hypothetical protein
MMQFPVSMPNDGKVDLVIQGMVSSCPSCLLRIHMLKLALPPLLLPFFFLSVIPRRNVEGF